METEIINLLCIQPAVIGLSVYGAMILGLEVGGRFIGYQGKGREMHKSVMKALKQVFFGNKHRPKK